MSQNGSASYLFMRLAVPHLGVAWVVEGRTLAGGFVLAGFMVLTRRDFAAARYWRGYAVVGITGVALPFWLIATGIRTIDASTAAILNATSPIFSAIVAALWIRERLTVEKVAGIALSIAGIAILVGWTPKPMSAMTIAASTTSTGRWRDVSFGFASSGSASWTGGSCGMRRFLIAIMAGPPPHARTRRRARP